MRPRRKTSAPKPVKSARRRRRKKKTRSRIRTYLSKKLGIELRLRSGWELVYVTHLDTADDVVTYAYEPVVIPYVSNVRSGRQRKYVPDFMVTYTDGHRELVEVKPLKYLSKAAVQKKLCAAQAWCLKEGVTMSIVTERELKTMAAWGRT